MSLLFPLVTFPYASRILLPEGTGKVNFANSIINYFGMLASLGIGTYGIREAAKVRHDKQRLSQFTVELFTINLLSTLIAYILLYISIVVVPKFHEYRMLLYMTSVTIIFTTMGISWLYSAVEEYGYIALRSVVFQVVSIILLFTFVKQKEDYLMYAGIGVVSSVGSNIFNIIHARKFISFTGLGRLELKKHVKPIFVFFGSTLAISVFTMLDTSMLGFLSTNEEVGFYSELYRLPEQTQMEELLALIEKLNNDEKINGILCQLPLPKHLDEEKVILAINPNKDVDAFHPVNTGKIMIGNHSFLPCTPAGVMKLIESTGTDISGKECVVIGRSNIVGKPQAMLLLQANGKVKICHSRTKDLKEVTKRADILVVAIGKADFVTGDMIKEGAIVIDVGMNRRQDGKLTGDVDFESAEKVASYITPVPGGVGPMTITMLLQNTLTAFKQTL